MQIGMRRIRGSSVEQSLPAANANNLSPWINPWPFRPEDVDFEVAIPALPNLTDGCVLTVQLYDSADGVVFAAIDPLIQTTVTGLGGAGSVPKTITFRPPPGTRPYVAFFQVVANGGGDNAAQRVAYTAIY